MTSRWKAEELAPVIDRYHWTLASRALVTVVLAILLLTDERSGADHLALLAEAAGWLMLTYAAVPLVRRWRRVALLAFSVGLLGDGVLLAWGWWSLGAADGRVPLLVCVHVLGATLLGSFRTGVKLALWHSVLAFAVVEMTAGLQPLSPMQLSDLAWYIGGLWSVTVLTAAFAAVNERELRRRRYDSEKLRLFGITLTGTQSPADVVRRLAGFARDDMLVNRIAIVVYPLGGEPAPTGFGLIAGPDGERMLSGLPLDGMDEYVRSATTDTPVRLLSRIDAVGDPGLAGWLPGARNVILLQYVMDQLRGVVAVSHDRGRGRSRRIERRVVVALHQAAIQAGVALGRELLTAQVRRAAERDALTGLSNRGTFNTHLARAVAEARAGGPGFGLIMVDLDHFKSLNDTHGHQTGDEALRAAARTLQACCGPADLAARYGGEEFAVIVAGPSHEHAVAVAERLRYDIEQTASPVPITASLGVAMFPAHAADVRSVLAAADAALYRAKETGRNRVAYANAAVSAHEAA
jgi:two-component system cell cycle response regulator